MASRPRRLAWLALLAAALVAGCLPASGRAASAASTLLVSRPDGLGAAPAATENNSDLRGGLSADGRYAVFTSKADGIAPGVNPDTVNVILRDTQTNTTTLVSRSDGMDGAAADGDATDPAVVVAPDGTMPDGPSGPHVVVVFTAFTSNFSDHTTGPVGAGPDEVWLRDVTAGTTYLVSRASGGGVPANGPASDPAVAIGPGGPVVAFSTNAFNLVAGANGGVYVETLRAAEVQQVSCKNLDCAAPSGAVGAYDPDIRVVASGDPLCNAAAHPDGCVLTAFDTADATLTGDPGAHSQVMVAAASAGTAAAPATGVASSAFIESRPNASSSVLGDDSSTHPSFDGQGRELGFLSKAGNLNTGDSPPAGVTEAYVRSLGGTSVTLLSKAAAPADADVYAFALGGTSIALRAVMTTGATNLGGGQSHAYLRDATQGEMTQLDRASGAAGAPGDAYSTEAPAISADGSAALFSSAADNLGDDAVNATSGYGNVHLRRLPASPDASSGGVELVSRPTGSGPPTSAGVGSSALPGGTSTSADGRYVLFNSSSDGLGGDDNGTSLYVRDLATGHTTLVSQSTGGVAATGSVYGGGISADGRYVAFSSDAGNLAPGSVGGRLAGYVRDLVARTTTLVTRDASGAPIAGDAFADAISADGSAVIFSTATPSDPAVSPADTHEHAYERKLTTGTTTLIDRDDGKTGAVADGDASEPVPDADGGRVAWWSDAQLAGAPALPGVHQVYRRDLATGSTVLVSRAAGAAGAAGDQDSRDPAIDGPGDLVAFSTRATTLGYTFPNSQVFVRDIAVGLLEPISRTPGTPGTSGGFAANAIRPSFDAAGDRVAFVSYYLAPGPDDASTQALVRDRTTNTLTLASRADKLDGAPASGSGVAFVSLSASGDCLAFSGAVGDMADGFTSTDFSSVHLRVLRNECATAPPSGGGGPGPGTGAGGTTPGTGVTPGQGTSPSAIAKPAVLSALKLSPARFRVGGKKGGTKIGYALDGAATVTLKVERRLRGRRKGKTCVLGRKKGARCTLYRTSGSLTAKSAAGKNTVKFSGRLKGKALKAGTYRLTATPAKGTAKTATFTVLAAKKPKK